MILKLLSNIYSYFVDRRNTQFENGKIKTYKLRTPVLSIGNIIAGGTGKTPVTILIAELLIKNNLKVGVVGRGYGRKSKGLKIVCDGINILDDSDEVGDEMLLIAKKLKIPVVIDQKKYIAAQEIENKFDLDVILIDDGFQHRYLERDIDILLINKDTLENPNTFPKGYLREKLSNYKRADIVLIDDISKKVLFESINNKVFEYQKHINKVRQLSSKKIKYIENYSLKTLAICSIANPNSFINFVNVLGFDIIKTIPFKDHYTYTKNDITSFIQECKVLNVNNIIMTEKDYVKVEKFNGMILDNNINILVLEMEIKIDNEKEFINNILTKISSNN